MITCVYMMTCKKIEELIAYAFTIISDVYNSRYKATLAFYLGLVFNIPISLYERKRQKLISLSFVPLVRFNENSSYIVLLNSTF